MSFIEKIKAFFSRQKEIENNIEDNISSPFSTNTIVYLWNSKIVQTIYSPDKEMKVTIQASDGQILRNKKMIRVTKFIELTLKVWSYTSKESKDDLVVFRDKTAQWMEEGTPLVLCIENDKYPVLYNEADETDRLILISKKASHPDIKWK